MKQHIRFPVYAGLRADIPFLKGDKTIGWIMSSGKCRIDFGDKELEVDGKAEVNVDVCDEVVEVINLSDHHIFVEVKYNLFDYDDWNRYKNNVLDDVNGFQFLNDDGQWYNYPY